MNKKCLCFSNEACLKIRDQISRFVSWLRSTHFDLILMGLVAAGMIFALADAVFAQGISDGFLVNTKPLKNVTCALFAYLEGSFGALIMVASGVGAIISSAFGQYRASLGLMVVAVGSFVLKSFVITFFGAESVTGGDCRTE